MKRATFGKATRTVGKMFFGLVLLTAAVGAGFGGTALIVYHQLGGSRPADLRTANLTRVEHKELARPVLPVAESTKDLPQTRRVAATSTDVPTYTYADNSAGQPSLPPKRQKTVANIPAALETSAEPQVGPSAPDNLNDPESHYIVDARTGRVVGIDGTAGAQREAGEQRRLDAAPRAVAVQTPPLEVRVASAVMEEGQPVYHGAQPITTNVPGSQYVPVRRAKPVTADSAALADARDFNVAAYLADDRSHPVSRAQPVYPASVRTARAIHVFRLPDGTQALVSD